MNKVIPNVNLEEKANDTVKDTKKASFMEKVDKVLIDSHDLIKQVGGIETFGDNKSRIIEKKPRSNGRLVYPSIRVEPVVKGKSLIKRRYHPSLFKEIRVKRPLTFDVIFQYIFILFSYLFNCFVIYKFSCLPEVPLIVFDIFFVIITLSFFLRFFLRFLDRGPIEYVTKLAVIFLIIISVILWLVILLTVYLDFVNAICSIYGIEFSNEIAFRKTHRHIIRIKS